jgi:hypothetical protein
MSQTKPRGPKQGCCCQLRHRPTPWPEASPPCGACRHGRSGRAWMVENVRKQNPRLLVEMGERVIQRLPRDHDQAVERSVQLQDEENGAGNGQCAHEQD